MATVILDGRGGELDRVTFKPRDPDCWTLAELVAALVKRDGRPWILGDGDTLRISQE